MEISCFIGKDRIRHAKIQVENGQFYICQNIRNGASCHDRLGFKYSWSIGDGSAYARDSYSVSRIKFFNKDNRVKIKLSKKKIGNKHQYLIEENIYNKLFDSSVKCFHYAKSFMLGRDKNYLICRAIPMKSNGGCYAMPSIPAEFLSKAMIEIYKEDLIPCGIARTGNFYVGQDERGSIISQLRHLNTEAILLSFSGADEVMKLEEVGDKKKSILKLFVVPDKNKQMKGGE
jgi:hypothetical protein